MRHTASAILRPPRSHFGLPKIYETRAQPIVSRSSFIISFVFLFVLSFVFLFVLSFVFFLSSLNRRRDL